MINKIVDEGQHDVQYVYIEYDGWNENADADFKMKYWSVVFFCPAQIMYATSPYSDPVVSADIDPQPIIDEEEGLIWVVGPVLAVVFIICIVIAILLYKR